MRGHGDVFGLGHDGDLLEFGDAAGVGDVGLKDVYGVVVDDVGEWEFGVEALAGGDGNGDFAADFEEFRRRVPRILVLRRRGGDISRGGCRV